MISDLVKAAQAQKETVSGVVSLCIDWFGYGDVAKATYEAIRKMNNSQKQEFAKGLLEAISTTRSRDDEKRKNAENELIALLGDDVLKSEIVQQSRDGFFFSLTASGNQFRAWHAPFGSVTQDHFDSCGSGCVFSAGCADPGVLREWLRPFVEGKAEWKSDFLGRVWIGNSRF